MAHSTRRSNPDLTEMETDPNRLMRVVRQQSNAPSLPAAAPSRAVENAPRNVASVDENRLAFWLDEARRAANDQVEDNHADKNEEGRGLDSPNYSPSLDEEDAEIVLRRSELKTIIDVAVTNTMTLIDERIISALQSCTDGNRLSPMGTAISTAVGTAVADQISQGMVSKMVKEEAFQLVRNPEVKTMIAAELTRSDELMSPIAKFVAKSVKQEARNVEYVRKEEPRIEVTPPSPPSSDPSDSESSRDSRRSRRSHRPRKSRKRRGSTSPSNSDWGSLSEDSMKSKPSIRSKKSSSSRLRNDDAPVLTVIRPVLDSFREALDYRTYRLRKRSQHFNGHVASNVAKFVKRLRSQLKETEFDESDPISVLAFLKEFRDACDSIGVHEGVAMWLFPHFMKKPASSSLSARLSSRKSKSSGLHDERLSSYVEVVNFMLATYATDDVIARAVKTLENYKQLPGMAPTDFAKRLYTKALRCGMVYEEKRVKSLFVEGLEDAVCDNVRLYWSRNPSEPLTQLARYADTVTKIADSRSTGSSSANRPNRDTPPNRTRNRRANQSFNVSDGAGSLVQNVSDVKRDDQTKTTTSSDTATYCRVCLREDHTLMRCPLVSQHAKLSQEREKNWETIRTKWDRRGGRWRGRGGRQWEDRRRDDRKDEKKDEPGQVVESPGNRPQGKE